MSIRELITWLGSSPILQGEEISWSFLPSYSGWSLSVQEAGSRTDILGSRREQRQLKITRRCTIQSDADRLAVAEALEELAAWAEKHPPEHTRLKADGLPELTSRNNSGIEDISITVTLTEV